MRNLTILSMIIVMVVSLSSNSLAAKTTAHLPDSSQVRIEISYPAIQPNEQLALLALTKPAAYSPDDSGFGEITQSRLNPTTIVFQFNVAKDKKGTYIILEQFENNKTIGDPNKEGEIVPTMILLHSYFVEPGDKIHLLIRRKTNFSDTNIVGDNIFIQFSGDGSEKFTARHIIDSLNQDRKEKINFFKEDSTYDISKGKIEILNQQSNQINQLADKIDKQALEELRIHAFYSFLRPEYKRILSDAKVRYKDASNAATNRFLQDYDTADLAFIKSFDEDLLETNYDFWSAELQKYITMSKFKHDESDTYNFLGSLTSIKNLNIKEKLIIVFVKANINNIEDLQSFEKRVLPEFISNEDKAELVNMGKMGRGKPAFNFELTDTNGAIVKLSQFKGKVVFMDFWYSGCGNCAEYYKNVLSKVERQFKSDKRFVFISISIDKNKDNWSKNVQRDLYTSAKVVNLYTNGQGAYNEAIRRFVVQGYPRPLIIDKSQRIFRFDGNLRIMPTLINALNDALQY